MPGRTVALETSTRSPSVALRYDDQTREVGLAHERPHASDLLPALRDTMRDAGVRPTEIDAVVVGTGPGSYTGLRVGIATALGLARGSGARLFALPSMEALVFGECAPGEEACVLLDARAGELYFARYRRSDEGVEPIFEPCITNRDEVRSLLEGARTLFADAAALKAAGLERDDLDVRDAVPRAAALLDLGCRRLEREGPHSAEEVQPLYLRGFAGRPRKR
jgi:tRNA threonylcarbamoyladenosine biosynthesis protein TsaB